MNAEELPLGDIARRYVIRKQNFKCRSRRYQI